LLTARKANRAGRDAEEPIGLVDFGVGRLSIHPDRN
jgi:hypothetical protein